MVHRDGWKPRTGGFAAKTQGDFMNMEFKNSQAQDVATALIRNSCEFKDDTVAHALIERLAKSVREGRTTSFNMMEMAIEGFDLNVQQNLNVRSALEKTIGEFSQSATRHAGGGGGKRQHGG